MGSESQLLLQILCMAIEKLGKGQRVRIFLKIVMFAQIDSPFFRSSTYSYFIFYISYFIFYIFQVVRSSLSLPPLRRGVPLLNISFSYLVALLFFFSSFFFFFFYVKVTTTQRSRVLRQTLLSPPKGQITNANNEN